MPQGQVFEFTMESKDSKIYPGIAREPNTFARQDPAATAQISASMGECGGARIGRH